MIAKVLRVLVPALFVYWFAALLLGWPFTPGVPVLSADVSEETLLELPDSPATRAQIRGALEQIVGSPGSPGFLLNQDWLDDSFDPNRPDQPWPADEELLEELGLTDYAGVYDEGIGSGELDAETFAAIVEGNRSRHADAIAALEKGDYDAVEFPAWTPALAAEYERWNSDREAGDYVPVVDFATDMVAMIETWYPRLPESAELYRRQCLHCHGVEGGGDGTTAPYLLPRPRDYRKGIFKFTSVANKARPRREDLYKLLHNGANGTAMPSFARFTPGELHGLADYVRLLSIRGEVEGLLTLSAVDNYGYLPAEEVQGSYSFVWDKWLEADDHFVAFEGAVPAATPELIAHGRELYNQKNDLGEFVNDCATCHGVDGRGRGASSYEDVSLVPSGNERDKLLANYDIDIEVEDGSARVEGHRFEFDAGAQGTVTIDLDPPVPGVHLVPGEEDTDEYFPLTVDHVGDRIGLKTLSLSQGDSGWAVSSLEVKRAKLDDWGNPIFARDFTRGVFRAGRRPIDVYRRVFSGINGSPMPDHSSYDPDVIWALVQYVRSLGTTDSLGPHEGPAGAEDHADASASH